MTIRRRWRVAMHEAGHAVAHVALGGTVSQVSARRAPQSSGRCWPSDALPPWETALVSLAGPCAELFIAEDPDIYHQAAAVLSGDPDNDIGGDWPTAHALADRHRFDFNDAAEEAAVLVLDYWPAIQAVARALRGSHRGLVSGAKVAEIMAGHSAATR